MNYLPFDIIHYISKSLNFRSYYNLVTSSKNLYNSSKLDIQKIIKKASHTICKFFYNIKFRYHDLRLSRKGYLINFEKLLKHPHFYVNKKIQFISRFQYHHNDLKMGDIGEGTLYYHSNTNSWFFNLDNSFYNYEVDEPLPQNHLLYRPFIVSTSVRVIKE